MTFQVLDFYANDDNSSDYSSFYENNGKVAYLYLVKNEEIVADVWLFNVDETPVEYPWKNDTQEMPFLNPKSFIDELKLEIPRTSDELSFRWHHDASGFSFLEFSVRGEVLAYLTANSRPGWSKYVQVAGPLGKPLNEFPIPR